jgi:DNA-binding transcriptional LysR family regulator
MRNCFAMAQNQSWDDLRYLLAVARTGSFLHAGHELGTAASTVQRRFGALERQLGTRLGDRTASGVSLTVEGKRLVSLAEELEARIATTTRDLATADARLSGRIRVTAGEGFGPFLLQVTTAFRAQHPDVTIELALDHRLHDLSRREADIGLRNVRPSAKPLVATRLGELQYGLYAAPDYARRRPLRSLSQLRDHLFVGLDGGAARSPEMRWLREHAATRFSVRTESIQLVLEAARFGHGVAALPHVLAQGHGLVQLLPEQRLPALPVWLVMHRELRAIERIRRFAQAIRAAAAPLLAAHPGLIER